MSSRLQITTSLTDDGYLVTAQLLPGSSLPDNIFIYTNTGTTDLGTYQGIVTLDDIARMQIWNGTAIPTFGNKYVRYNQAKIQVSLGTDVKSVISVLTQNITNLSSAFQAQSTSTQVISIP